MSLIAVGVLVIWAALTLFALVLCKAAARADVLTGGFGAYHESDREKRTEESLPRKKMV